MPLRSSSGVKGLVLNHHIGTDGSDCVDEDATLLGNTFIVPYMTDRELLFALLGVLGNDTDLLIGSLILIKRQVPLETIAECQDEMARLVRNLQTLSEPRASAFVKDLINELKSRENN